MADSSVKHIGLKMTLDASSVKAESQASGQALAGMAAQGEAAAARTAQSLGKVELSAKQTAMAMRMLPAQMTDIAVGLSTGQSPFMVMMQQGGQLKDMFGGIGPAVRAVAGQVVGLINPVTLAGGAMLALGAAAYKGSQEHAAHANALAMSGNAAGVTADQLAGMARALDDGTRTQAAAAAAVDQMAQVTTSGAQELQRYAGIALDWERVTGSAVSETADQFRALQDDPLRASLKLNEGLNYLTASTYEHIKALVDQGRHVDAVRVAQDAMADALRTRTVQVTQNLGLMERGWQSVKGAAMAAWDAMLNVGRAQTSADKLAGVRKELAALETEQARAGFASNGGGAAFGRPDTATDSRRAARIAQLQAEAAALNGVMDADRKAAEAKAESIRQDQAKIKWSQDGEKYLSKQAQLERDITKARNEGAAAGVSQAEIEKRIAAIREDAAGKGGRSAALRAERKEAQELAKDLRVVAESAGLQPGFYEEWNRLNGLHAKGKMSVEELTAAQAKLLAQQPAIKAAADAQAKADAELLKMEAALHEQRLKTAEAAEKQAEQLVDGNEKLRDEIAQLGLSKEQQTLYAQAKLDSAIATKEEQLALAQKQFTNTREEAALEEQIRLLRERRDLLGQRAVKEADLEGAKAVKETEKASEQMGQALANSLMRGGKSAKEYLVDMFRTTVLQPVLAPIMGNLASTIQSMLGLGGSSAAGSAGSLLSTASNASTLYGLLGGGGALPGTLTFANTVSAVGGDGLSALIAANGWGNTGGAWASMFSSSAMGAAALAAPLLIGSLVESNSRDRISGAAFATSSGDDAAAHVVAGSTAFDQVTGALPDRAALIEALRGYGMTDALADGASDRSLYHALQQAVSESRSERESGPIYNFAQWLADDSTYAADFYRGAGYTDPQAEGWWNNKGYDLVSSNPELTAASRSMAESIVGPLTTISQTLGGSAEEFKATVGFALRGKGGTWAGVDISQGDESLYRSVDTESYGDYQDAIRGVYSGALEAFKSLDLPAWASKEVDDTRTAMAALDGDDVGTQAAALYQSASAEIASTISTIQRLIDVFPEFANATQDSAHAVAEAMGGMDKMTTAYSGFVQNFYSDAERASMMRAELEHQFTEIGQDMPATREQFRDMVRAALDAGKGSAELAAQLLGLADAANTVLPAVAQASFEGGSELAGMIRDGLLGTFDGGNVGVAMAQSVETGAYNAIAGGFADQITNILVAGIVQPTIAAAMAGSSASAAVSSAAIAEIVAQAQAVATAAAAVLNDPAVQAAISAAAQAVGSIGIAGRGSSSAASGVTHYATAVSESGNAAEQAADQVADAWRSIADTLIDEVRRIRGELADEGANSLAYWQAQFAIDTAAARAGDQEAAQRLTSISGSLLNAAEDEAGSLLELQRIRAATAQSLQDTAGYAAAMAGSGGAAGGSGSGSGAAGYATSYDPWAVFEQRAAAEQRALMMRDQGWTSDEYDEWLSDTSAWQQAQRAAGRSDTAGTPALDLSVLSTRLDELIVQSRSVAGSQADLQVQMLRIFREWQANGMPIAGATP